MYPVMLDTFATQITEQNCEDDNKTLPSETTTVKLLVRKDNEKHDDFTSLNNRRGHAMKYINIKVWR